MRGLAIYLTVFPLIISLVVSQAGATQTKIWIQRSYKDFSAGEAKGVSISSKGEVTLSFKLDKIGDMEEVFVWDLVKDSQGNLYAGTGKEGRVYKISPDGKAEIFFDSPEVNVHSLLIDKSGNIYAGTAPDGLIFKITPDKLPSTFFTSGEKYIWDLAMDESGNLYAATGPNGKIFKITPEGVGEVLFDSEETNIVCLYLRGDTLYAGGDKNGTLYAISLQTGKVSVVYDAQEKEIHTLVMDEKGNIYAAATTGAPPQPGGPGAGGEQEQRKSSIYLISTDGVVRKIWTAPDPLILSLSFDPEGRLLVGTGDSGKIYSVTPDGRFSMLAKCDSSQVLTIYRDGKSLYLGTGNGGMLYTISSDRSKEGEITSKVFDASIVSRWGNILWEADTPQGTSVLLSTRSGNTSKPDNTWSDWSEEYTASDGSLIKSPPSRFIQWRAKLRTSDPSQTPRLKSVWVTYLQGNVPPEIVKISVDGDESKGDRTRRELGPPQRGPSPPAGAKSGKTKTIKWQVRDPNEDKLIFSVYLKGVDEGNWRLLKEKLEKSSYQFDSSTLPDGWYHVKVVASDLPSNPPDMSKVVEKISDPFLVDNSQPTISDISVTVTGEQVTVTFSASDPTSLLKSASYSLDNKDWMVLFPDDGLFDSKSESFKLELKGLSAGAHTISVRVSDIAGNLSSARKGFSK